MSDHKDNNPNSFDSYKIIGSDNDIKREEKVATSNEAAVGGVVQPPPPPQQPAEQPRTFYETPQGQPQQPPNTAYSYGPSPGYQNQPGPGYGNQYAATPAKKFGQAGMIFWLLFALLAIFDLLLLLGGSGILFFGLAVIVLAVMFVTRKSISHGIVKTILYFGGALLVTVAIFAFAGTGGSNGANLSVGGNSDSKVFDFSFNIGSKDQPEVVQEGFARSIEPNTLQPIDKVTVFTPNDEFMYYSVFVKYLPENTEIVSKWYYEGNLVIETEPVKVPAALQNQYYTTHLQKGEKPFPVGNYKVELIMSKDGKTNYQCSDEFAVVANSGTPSSQVNGEKVLFADSFQRPDANVAGNQWQEVRMRNGTGSSIPSKQAGDTPWSIKNNTLSYEGVGNNTYTEDFIQTVQEFPIENTKVEFEIRGTARTMLGYVGPGAFWAPAPELRLGSFTTVDGKQPLIGVQAFYGWESQGTKGLVFRLGEGFKTTDGVLAGINQNEFVKHTIILKDGKMIYQVAGGPSVTYDLANKLEPGAKRHFSFDVRYYDNGVPFKAEIRNLKITTFE